MVWLRRLMFGLAVALVGLSFLNASWLVPNRPGHVRLIANGGIAQDYAPGARRAPCPASAILPPLHTVFEDSLRAVFLAHRMGADLVAIDLVRTADGALVLYPDTDLACRTGVGGAVSAHSLADLRQLDIGHGYTADHGATFPLRGLGRGLIVTLGEVLDSDPKVALLYRFPGNDPAALDLAMQVLRAHGHDPVALKEGFVGSAAMADTVRKAFPGVWTLVPDQAAACVSTYRVIGWTGLVPGSCQGSSVTVPLDATWSVWGWPARFETRINAGHGVVIAAASADGTGLRHSRQLSDIPVSYRGYAMVDNFWTVGPALRPSLDARTNAEAVAAQTRDDAGSQ
jgi:glycerophosphoryl diester phosphodiesterase